MRRPLPGRGPIVSVWHGCDDRTVSVRNGAAIAAQWADLHGATSTDSGAAGREGRVWRNTAGVAVVEFHEVAGMGHGTPIDSGDGGVAAPFMLDVGIASSARIAAFWSIAPADATRPAVTTAPKPKVAAKPAKFAPADRGRPHSPLGDVTALINSTLRAAGLMK